MKFLITYGNQNYQKAKERLILEAHQTQQFDVIKAYGPEDLPPQITSIHYLCAKKEAAIGSGNLISYMICYLKSKRMILLYM